jgi:hypothetical protein
MFVGGNDLPGVVGTLWAAYNGIAVMVDHGGQLSEFGNRLGASGKQRHDKEQQGGQVTFDKLFRIALLTVLLAFLYIAWGMKDNGRYVYHPETGHEKVRAFSRIVIDSRTGTLFTWSLEQNLFLEFHPQTGETAAHWTWSKPVKTSAPEKAVPEPGPER